MSVESVDWDDLRDAINDGTIEGDPHRDRLLAMLTAVRQDVVSAEAVLDLWGAPKTVHNPYGGGDVTLNLGGRIDYLIDPENKGLQRTASNQEGDAEFIKDWVEQQPVVVEDDPIDYSRAKPQPRRSNQEGA